MSKQLHKLQEVKQSRRLTHDKMRMHKSKRNMLYFNEIFRSSSKRFEISEQSH